MTNKPLKISIKKDYKEEAFRFHVSSDHMGDYGFEGELATSAPVVLTYDEIADLRDYLDEILKTAEEAEKLKDMPWLLTRLRKKK